MNLPSLSLSLSIDTDTASRDTDGSLAQPNARVRET
jgi:hypothetical protein